MSRACRAHILPLNYIPYNMTIVVIFLPLLNAIIAGLFGRLVGRNGARIITCSGMIVNLTFSLILIVNYLNDPQVYNIKLGT